MDDAGAGAVQNGGRNTPAGFNQCVNLLFDDIRTLMPVYVPNAVASDHGTANLRPLGLAAEALHLELTPPPGVTSAAHASVAINSLGPIDNLQIAATGLQPGKKYWVVLVGSAEPLELVTFSAGIGGAAIAQALGPLKRAMAPSQVEHAMKLEVRLEEKGGALVLQQR